MPQRVFVDANILASRTILDWSFALQCLSGNMFVFYTSQDVLVEAVRVRWRKFPTAPGKIVNDRVNKVGAVMEEILFDFSGDLPFDGLDQDDFLMLVHDSAPHLVLRCTRQQLDYWQTQENFRGLSPPPR